MSPTGIRSLFDMIKLRNPADPHFSLFSARVVRAALGFENLAPALEPSSGPKEVSSKAQKSAELRKKLSLPSLVESTDTGKSAPSSSNVEPFPGAQEGDQKEGGKPEVCQWIAKTRLIRWKISRH